MTRRKTATLPPTFVVYVTYPGSQKEYAYLCNLPCIKQGSEVLGNNGTRVTVVRTAGYDPIATRWVAPLPDQRKIDAKVRREAIKTRLREIERQLKFSDWAKTISRRSPEAKKLLTEYTKINKEFPQ